MTQSHLHELLVFFPLPALGFRYPLLGLNFLQRLEPAGFFLSPLQLQA